MNKHIQTELTNQYNDIFRTLYINYTLGLDDEYNTLHQKGLHTSGISTNAMYKVVERLVFETIDKLDKLISEISFNFKPVSSKDLLEFINKSNTAINESINNMQNIIYKKLKNINLSNNETFNNSIQSLKGNCNHKMKQIYSKYQNRKTIKWLIVINTIATIDGFVLSIASFIFSIYSFYI